MSEMACRTCKRVFRVPRRGSDVCPFCKTRTLTDNWNGLVVVFNPDSSILAEKIGVEKPGRYAINVGR